MPFKKFIPEDARVRLDVPSGSLLKGGILSLNKHALALIGAPKQVFLYFDADAQQIGIEAAPDDAVEAAPVRPHGSASGFRVPARGFVKQFKIDVSVARTMRAALNIDGLLVLDLNKSVGTTSRVKPKPGAKSKKKS